MNMERPVASKLHARITADVERVKANEVARTNPTFRAALDFWHRGLHPLPIIPHEKKPYSEISWKPYQTTQPTLKEITTWWAKYPNAWLGIITGQAAGLMVIDVDPRHDGSLDGLDVPPGAPMTKTPRGGNHIWLAYPQHMRIRGKTLRPGVELKADGGMAMAPPSTGYSWIIPFGKGTNNLPNAPDWIFIEAQRRSEKPQGWFAAEFNEVTVEGQRNENAARYSGYLFQQGVSADDTLSLLQSWADRCDPPFPIQELETVVASIARKHDASKTETRQQTLEFHVPSALPIKEINFLIEGLVPAGTVTLLYGKDKLGKTLLAMEMAKAIQAGIPFLGHFPVTQGSGMYLFMDDPAGLTYDRLINQLHFTDEGVQIATHLDTPDDPRELLTQLANAVATHKPDFVILDALYVLLWGADQLHSVDGMKNIMRTLDKMAEQHGCAVLVIHHPRKKDHEAAGSFVIRAIAKSIIGLRPGLEIMDRHLLVEGKFAAEARYYLRLEDGPSWVFGGQADAAEYKTVEREVVDLVMEESGTLTTLDISKRLKRKEATVRTICNQQLEKGIFRKEVLASGKPGRSRTVWCRVPRDPQLPDGDDLDLEHQEGAWGWPEPKEAQA
jgi:putative DNA primase/helicase